MGELTAADLETYTGGRLDASDSTTQDLVTAALAAARRYCGWSVSPVVSTPLVVDGPGGRVLSLPTRNLLAVTAVSEHGVALDVTKLDVSRRKGTVVKHPCGHWSHRNGSISVTMVHGFTENEAADWRRAVLRLADLTSLDPQGDDRDSTDMRLKRVNHVEYEWSDKLISTDDRLSAMFAPFMILQSP